MTNIVIQSFGRENEYKRAILTILSYFATVTAPLDSAKVLLFTDNPEYFNLYLKGLPIQYILLTKEKIKIMRGSIDFLHRMKIAMIEEAFNVTDGNILYTDSDTFFIADPNVLLNNLSEKQSYMHLPEYVFESMNDMPLPAGAPFQAFLKLIMENEFVLADGNKIKINPKNYSWNAGVMFFHHSHSKFIPDVYSLTDQFYPPTQNHASEQYAFSIILQNNTELKRCDEVIYHYWFRVLKSVMDLFLEKNMTSEWATKSLDEKIKQVKDWIKMMPDYLENHEMMLRDNAIQAFTRNDFKAGYIWTLKTFLKNPFQGKRFVKDVLHSTKRLILKK